MSKAYWQQRFEQLEAEQMDKAGKSIGGLKKAYVYALRKLQDEVAAWYARYAQENDMTLSEARKLLDNRELKAFKLTLAQYTEIAQRKNLSNAYIKLLDRASIRARLDRSQVLYIKMVQQVELLAKQQHIGLNDLLFDVYKDSYYKTAYETQCMRGRFSNFAELPKNTAIKVISRPWADDGKDFSDRIWENKTKLINTLQSEVMRTLIAAEGATTLSARIAARFHVSFENARRLAETETAYVQEAARMDTWTKLDVERYQLVATLDSRTSSICRRMDGKIFDRKDAKAGITMPPFHCYCRTTTVPYIEGITDNDNTRAARDPKTGKTTQVSGDLTYGKWYNKYVKLTDTDGVIGMKAKNGITISGISQHQKERMEQRKVSVVDVQDALTNPLHISEINIDEKGSKSQRFIGTKATVNINPDTGTVVTTWRTGKSTIKKYRK